MSKYRSKKETVTKSKIPDWQWVQTPVFDEEGYLVQDNYLRDYYIRIGLIK